MHSKCPRHILGYGFDATSSGTTVVRFMLPSASIKADPQTAHLIERDGQSNIYISSDRRRYLLQYPLRDNTEQNFTMYSIKDSRDDMDAQVLRFRCDQDSLRTELEGFHESILALVPKTAQILPVWKLVERAPLPVWYRQRLLVIGDAAHPMLPNQAQGAGMAVEDAGALSIIFSQMADTSATAIMDRLALFQQIRKSRASVVQLLSSVPYFENGVKRMWPQLLEHLPAEALPGFGGAVDVRPWLFRYDILEESRRLLDQYLQSKAAQSTHSAGAQESSPT